MITLDCILMSEPSEDLRGRSETWFYVGDE